MIKFENDCYSSQGQQSVGVVVKINNLKKRSFLRVSFYPN